MSLDLFENLLAMKEGRRVVFKSTEQTRENTSDLPQSHYLSACIQFSHFSHLYPDA